MSVSGEQCQCWKEKQTRRGETNSIMYTQGKYKLMKIDRHSNCFTMRRTALSVLIYTFLHIFLLILDISFSLILFIFLLRLFSASSCQIVLYECVVNWGKTSITRSISVRDNKYYFGNGTRRILSVGIFGFVKEINYFDISLYIYMFIFWT